MRWLVVAAAAGLVALGCSSVQPLRIEAGERCFRCGRTIEDPKLAGEIIDEGGHALKFRSVTCMAKYVAEHGEHEWRGMWVTDYGTGKFVKTSNASFAPIVLNPISNERGYAAYSSAEAAAAQAKEVGGTVTQWEAVLASVQQP